jgi:hypothetical protein
MVRPIEKSNDLIGIRTRKLPAYSIVPQPTTSSRAPVIISCICKCYRNCRHTHRGKKSLNTFPRQYSYEGIPIYKIWLHPVIFLALLLKRFWRRKWSLRCADIFLGVSPLEGNHKLLWRFNKLQTFPLEACLMEYCRGNIVEELFETTKGCR